MSDQIYREIILEHWKHPQNYGVLQPADIDVSDSNPLCGDQIRITAQVKDGKVTKLSFTAEGCAVSKASASLYTEEVKGKTFEAISAMTPEDVVGLLEVVLTPARTKCALLVYQTLMKGIKTIA